MSAPERQRSRHLRRWAGGLVVGVLLAAAVTAIPSVRRGLLDPAGREPVAAHLVEVRDDTLEYFAFTPSVVTVPAGSEVRWRFTSGTEHNVVFADGASSPLLVTGDAWSRTFDAAGDYPYLCTLHAGMAGRVVVHG